MKKFIIIAFALAMIIGLVPKAVFAGNTSQGPIIIDGDEAEYYKEQVKKYEEMKMRTINVHVSHSGGYVAKKSDFYARKITGVEKDGSFILGNWECVDSHTNECMGDDYFTLPGNYVSFGYSLDIVWGTDFPFSGVFWNNIDQPVNDIEIRHGGIARLVYVFVYVNGDLVFRDDNCSSHDEWKPC